MKNKKKWITIGVVALVLVISVYAFTNANAGSSSPYVDYVELNKTELINSISTKGVVESNEKSNVYSYLGYQIKDVNVEVGDTVTVGDILCVLDTEELELNISQQKAEMTVSQQSSYTQIKSNQRLLNEASSNLNNKTNPQILTAKQSLTQSESALTSAQKTYDDLAKDQNNLTNQQIINAESNHESARLDFELKSTQYENNKALYEAGALSKAEFDQTETLYLNAKSKYDDTAVTLENSKLTEDRSLENAKLALDTAQISYNNALSSLNATEKNAVQDLNKHVANIESAQISGNVDSKLIMIQKLENNLQDATITSPISGTVTAVYAKEGANSSGLLFVVEDTEDLKITTKVKEYDIVKVKPKMDVVIKSDATGDSAYEGEILKINPAAIKNATGDTTSTDDVEFLSEVIVTEKDNELKIGMNTRLTIILEKKDSVYAVPYDSIKTNENNESVIFIIEEDVAGKPVARQIPIEIGMETDFYVEISGDKLSDGMKVIMDSSTVNDGDSITFK